MKRWNDFAVAWWVVRLFFWAFAYEALIVILKKPLRMFRLMFGLLLLPLIIGAAFVEPDNARGAFFTEMPGLRRRPCHCGRCPPTLWGAEYRKWALAEIAAQPEFEVRVLGRLLLELDVLLNEDHP